MTPAELALLIRNLHNPYNLFFGEGETITTLSARIERVPCIYNDELVHICLDSLQNQLEFESANQVDLLFLAETLWNLATRQSADFLIAIRKNTDYHSDHDDNANNFTPENSENQNAYLLCDIQYDSQGVLSALSKPNISDAFQEFDDLEDLFSFKKEFIELAKLSWDIELISYKGMSFEALSGYEDYSLAMLLIW